MKLLKGFSDVSRRNFLRFMAGAAAGTATSGVTLKAISNLSHSLTAEKRPPRGPERWVTTTCQACQGGCGLTVRCVGKRAIRIQGNPLHPLNRGGICPKGQALLQLLYHPDRFRQPLWQTRRGSGRWEKLSWEEALQRMTNRLWSIRQAGHADRVAVLDGARPATTKLLWRRFLEAYGSPNFICYPGTSDGPSRAGYYMQGINNPPAYDLRNAGYILSFGANLLEGWGSPIYAMRAFGAWRTSEGQRTKFVQISPRLSVTAAKSDEWVPIRAGTEAALALGIAHVLISEGRANEKFIADHTFGYEDWTDALGVRHEGFSTIVLRDYHPNTVAELTGVPVETILRLGREFAANPPALALGDQPGNMQPGTLHGSMAIQSLNALVGNFEQPGGVLIQPESVPSSVWGTTLDHPEGLTANRPPILATVQSAWKGDVSDQLTEAVLKEGSSPIECLIVHESNPAYLSSDRSRFAAAMGKIPFIVDFATLPDDTTQFADLILPAPTFLETWSLSETAPTFPYAVLGLSQPVIAPRHSSRHPGDVLLELAKRMGSPFDKALPFDNMEQAVQQRSKDLFAAQRGYAFGTPLEEVWDNLLEKSGWWAPDYATADELWEQMKSKGGWWDPTYHFSEWERAFRTPSRKFEFFSQLRWKELMAENGGNLNKAAFAVAERLCMPHFPIGHPEDGKPHGPGQDEQFPFLLFPYEILPLNEMQGADLPYMEQILGQHLYEKWQSWIELHPETARHLGIEDGSFVWVESRLHKVRMRARLYVGLRPEVVAIPIGLGNDFGSRWSRGRGVNPCEMLAPRESAAESPGERASRWVSTRVRIYPA